MINIEEEIKEIEEVIEGAKIEKAQAQGVIKANLKQLKDDFELHSLKEAESYVETAFSEIEDRDSEIEEKYSILKEKIDGRL